MKPEDRLAQSARATNSPGLSIEQDVHMESRGTATQPGRWIAN
jgi:hypothetical protein